MHYEKATGLDATWLHAETEDVPLHVASVPIFQLEDDTDPDVYFDQVKQLVRERAPHLKNYRMKRVNTPLGLDHPVWHDDVRNIDIDYHVRRTRLPKPGTLDQLEAACARIAAAPMNLNRPLWEYHVIEGLQGNRIAVFIKVHHAVIDGELGVMQLDLMMDSTPAPKRLPIEEPAAPAPAPTSWDLLSGAMVDFMRQPFAMLEQLPGMLQAAQNVSGIMLDRLNSGSNLTRVAPPTPFNRAVSRTRRFAMASVPLADAKAIKNALGVTLNDVVMAVSGGALRRYLKRKGANLDDELLAMVPVSLRKDSGNSDHAGTLVTGMVCGLATDVDDPVARAYAVNKNSVESKAEVEATKDAFIQNYNIAGAPIALRLASQVYGSLRLADFHQPMFNVTISNVAGPRRDIYFNGARMLHYHPVSLVAHGQGLNITVQSYQGTLDFGLISCAKLVPDLAELRDDLLASFEALKQAALDRDAGGIEPPTGVADLAVQRSRRKTEKTSVKRSKARAKTTRKAA